VNVEAETRYARSGDVSIAYQVTGEGPFDVVYVPGFVSHVELTWGVPGMAAFQPTACLVLPPACPTASVVCRPWRRAWTTSALSWMQPDRSVQP
jgi:hypothetical protein